MADRIDDRTLYMRQWRAKNAEHYAKYRAKWRKKNRRKVNRQQQEWREKNREHFAAYQREYREKNREKLAAAKRKYDQEHPEKHREAQRKWAKANPERVAAAGRVSLAKERYPGSLTVAEVLDVIERSGRTCHWCGKTNLQGRDLTLEHLKPVNDVAHLVVACLSCNCAKLSLRTPDAPR